MREVVTMKRENQQSFQFFYDEVGEKEIMEQMTNAYQSGNDYTMTQEQDSQIKELLENKAF
jgi:hypothetical protein